MKKKLLRTAFLGNLAVVVLCLAVYLSSTLTVLTNALYDMDMKYSATNEDPHDVVVVGIDDESLKQIGRWPWDRKTYIPLIQKLEESGVKTIVFDIMMNESGDPESDKALAEELAKHKNIVMPVQAVFGGKYNEIENDTSTAVNRNEARKSKDVTRPIDAFYNATQHAHANANKDPDGVIRKTFLEIDTPEGKFPSLAVKAVQLAGVDTKRFTDKYPYEMPIRYDLRESDFQTLPFYKVMTGSYNLKDRIVFIGFSAAGLELDNGTTPLESSTKLVYVHANIANQLMGEKEIAPENGLLTLLIMAILLLLPLWFAWRMKPITGILLTFVLAGAFLFGQYYVFSGANMYFNVIYGILAMFVSFLTNISIKTYFETKQKNYITKQFGRYISPELVKEIAGSDQEIQLGGINKELSILFLDVRGFTTLSERLKPEEVVGFLNMMFNLITERALENHGTIDKFIGDAAMILFNAPLDVPNHEYYAVKTAYDIQKGMGQVRQDILDKYGVTISVGIGINTGDVVVGNIGSYLRVDYTAIGDNVNTAARIESNTTANQVLVSEATYERTKDYFEFNFFAEKMMKGKTVPIKLYEVIDHLKAAGAAEVKEAG